VGSQPSDSPTPPPGGEVGGWGGRLRPTRRVAASGAWLPLAVYEPWAANSRLTRPLCPPAPGLTAKYLWTNSLLAGAFYYLYNEVAFLALGRVNPVTHAIGNTVKRVVIIIASVIAFKTPISTLGIIGSSIAIAGTLLYSLAKSKFG